MIYDLSNDKLKIQISSYGAELIHVVRGEKEYLWQNDSGSWDRCAPILFPVCGHCSVVVDGKDYGMPMHGFACNMEFALKDSNENSVTLRLVSNETTKKIYPYDFILDVKYLLDGETLTISYDVQNVGNDDMYYSCGGHESFNITDFENHALRFPKNELFLSLEHNAGGVLTGKIIDLGKGKILKLKNELLKDGSNTVILKDLNSKEVELINTSTDTVEAKVEFPCAPFLLVWRPDGGNTVCIEPWHNLPDIVGEVEEYSNKLGVCKIASGESAKIYRKITYIG